MARNHHLSNHHDPDHDVSRPGSIRPVERKEPVPLSKRRKKYGDAFNISHSTGDVEVGHTYDIEAQCTFRATSCAASNSASAINETPDTPRRVDEDVAEIVEVVRDIEQHVHNIFQYMRDGTATITGHKLKSFAKEYSEVFESIRTGVSELQNSRLRSQGGRR